MKINYNEYFKMVTADDGKLLSQKENGEAHIMKMVYVPLAMSDEEINSRYIQINENDFDKDRLFTSIYRDGFNRIYEAKNTYKTKRYTANEICRDGINID